MSISHGDNPLKYMDISEKVPMSESEVNHILKGKGILEDQGHTFIKAQDKYEVNIIYLISHALVETGNGKSELAKGVKDGSHRYYNFMELALSMKMLSILVKAMLNNNPGLHLVKQLWVAHLSYVIIILKIINLIYIKCVGIHRILGNTNMRVILSG